MTDLTRRPVGCHLLQDWDNDLQTIGHHIKTRLHHTTGQEEAQIHHSAPFSTVSAKLLLLIKVLFHGLVLLSDKHSLVPDITRTLFD